MVVPADWLISSVGFCGARLKVSDAVLMRCGAANGRTLKRSKDMSDLTNAFWPSLKAACLCVCG